MITFYWRLIFVLVLIGALADICLRSSATARFSPARRILLSIGAMALIVLMMWTPLLRQYRAEYPIASIVYVAPAVWFPQPTGAWYMRIMHFGPDPVYNVHVYFEDDDRFAQIKNQRNGISNKQIQDAVINLAYPEIDPLRGGLILNPQFTWSPVNPDREHYTIAINTRDGGFIESLFIEQSGGKWLFRLIVKGNPGAALIDCCDPGFRYWPELEPVIGFPDCAKSALLPRCFPTYTAIPGPDLSPPAQTWLPEDSTNRVMYVALMLFAVLCIAALYVLFALWLMGVCVRRGIKRF